jgi:hypothetical protein
VEVLFVYFPSPDAMVNGNFGLIRHAFSTIIDSNGHMSYRGLHTAQRKLITDTTAFAVFIFIVNVRRQQLGMHVLGQRLDGFVAVQNIMSLENLQRADADLSWTSFAISGVYTSGKVSNGCAACAIRV